MGHVSLAFRMQAVAVAYRALSASLTLDDLTALHAAAARDLAPDAPERAAVDGFVRQLRDSRFCPARQVELGRSLRAYVETLNLVDPPDLGRKDIYG